MTVSSARCGTSRTTLVRSSSAGNSRSTMSRPAIRRLRPSKSCRAAYTRRLQRPGRDCRRARALADVLRCAPPASTTRARSVLICSSVHRRDILDFAAPRVRAASHVSTTNQDVLGGFFRCVGRVDGGIRPTYASTCSSTRLGAPHKSRTPLTAPDARLPGRRSPCIHAPARPRDVYTHPAQPQYHTAAHPQPHPRSVAPARHLAGAHVKYQDHRRPTLRAPGHGGGAPGIVGRPQPAARVAAGSGSARRRSGGAGCERVSE